MPSTTKPPPYWNKARRHLKAADDVMAALIRDSRAAALRPRDDPFFSLARSIVGQQISVKAAESVWGKLEDAAGDITPGNVTDLGADRLRACGVTRMKAGYLMSLSGHFLDGSLDVPSCKKLADEAVIEQLTQVKGIGRWTAEMFLIFYLQRPDVLPLGDIGVQRAIGNHYNGGERPDAEAMRRFAEPWRPWRSVAVWYLWRSLDAVPVDY